MNVYVTPAPGMVEVMESANGDYAPENRFTFRRTPGGKRYVYSNAWGTTTGIVVAESIRDARAQVKDAYPKAWFTKHKASGRKPSARSLASKSILARAKERWIAGIYGGGYSPCNENAA
jgi:hypothetical protein